MSCGTCGIQASDTMQGDTGVPAGAPTTTNRPRCPHCKAFVAQEGGPCHNPRCPAKQGRATTGMACGRWTIPDQCATCRDPTTGLPYPAEGYGERRRSDLGLVERRGICHRCTTGADRVWACAPPNRPRFCSTCREEVDGQIFPRQADAYTTQQDPQSGVTLRVGVCRHCTPADRLAELVAANQRDGAEARLREGQVGGVPGFVVAGYVGLCQAAQMAGAPPEEQQRLLAATYRASCLECLAQQPPDRGAAQDKARESLRLAGEDGDNAGLSASLVLLALLAGGEGASPEADALVNRARWHGQMAALDVLAAADRPWYSTAEMRDLARNVYALALYHRHEEHQEEAERWLDQAYWLGELVGDSQFRAQTRYQTGLLAEQRQEGSGHSYFIMCADLARTAGDKVMLADCLVRIARHRGTQFLDSKRELQEAHALYEELGADYERSQAICAFHLALAVIGQDHDIAAGWRLLDESATLSVAYPVQQAEVRHNMADLAWGLQDYALASQCYASAIEAVETAQRHGLWGQAGPGADPAATTAARQEARQRELAMRIGHVQAQWQWAHQGATPAGPPASALVALQEAARHSYAGWRSPQLPSVDAPAARPQPAQVSRLAQQVLRAYADVMAPAEESLLQGMAGVEPGADDALAR